MANEKIICDRQDIVAIADAVRAKNGTTAEMTLSQISTSIADISDGVDPMEIARSIVNKKILEYSDDKITEISQYALIGAFNMTYVNIPNVTRINDNAFNACMKLKTVIAPKAKEIGGYAFKFCYELTTLDTGLTTSFGAAALDYCSKLTTLILRNTSTVAPLSSASILSETAIATGTGYIYVPAALVNSYKTATNWSNYASQIRAIEDYPDITGGAS